MDQADLDRALDSVRTDQDPEGKEMDLPRMDLVDKGKDLPRMDLVDLVDLGRAPDGPHKDHLLLEDKGQDSLRMDLFLPLEDIGPDLKYMDRVL